MQIRIPMAVVKVCERIGDIVNIELYRKGNIDIRIIDILFVLGFIACTIYYYWIGDWKTAMTGALMYIFCGMLGLWFFRGQD